MEHFQRVCQSLPSKSAAVIVTNEDKNSDNEHNQTTLPGTELSLLLYVTAGAPSSLGQTILPAKLNGLPVQSLLDTGASKSFVNEDVAKTAKLKICGKAFSSLNDF